MKVGRPWGEADPRDLRLRPYEATPADLLALTQVRNATLRETTPPGDFQEWDAARMERFYNRGDFQLEGNAWLLFLGEMPVGAAVVYPRAFFSDRPPGNFDLYVVPQYAQHGLGSRLLAHIEQAAAARGHRTLETTVAREDGRSTRFLEGRGFRVVGQSAHLTRQDLDTLPELRLPSGYAIYALTELGGEPELYQETTNRLGAYDANYTLVTDWELEAAVAGDRWEPGGIFFLFDDESRIVGVIRSSGARTGNGYLHEVRLDPALRGKGLGSALLAKALYYLRHANVARAGLDTKGEGTAAHSLAVRSGFAVTAHWLHYLKQLRSA